MEKTTISVQEMAAEMGISLPKAYVLVKESDYPTIHVGNRSLRMRRKKPCFSGEV